MTDPAPPTAPETNQAQQQEAIRSDPIAPSTATEWSPGTQVVVHDAEAATMDRAARGLPEVGRWQQMMEMSSAMARSGLVPTNYRNKPDNVLLVLLAANDLGITATQALAKLHVIEGRLSMSAELMTGLVLAEGHEVWAPFPVTTESATVCGRRKGGQQVSTVTFTVDDAVTAGLCTIDETTGTIRARDSNGNKKPWEKYPKAMLWARCVSALCRMVFPDVLAGITYTPEELDVPVDEHGDAIDVPSTVPSEREQFPPLSDSAKDAIKARIGALSEDGRGMLADEWRVLTQSQTIPALTHARECDVAGIDALISRWEDRDTADAEIVPDGDATDNPGEAPPVPGDAPDAATGADPADDTPDAEIDHGDETVTERATRIADEAVARERARAGGEVIGECDVCGSEGVSVVYIDDAKQDLEGWICADLVACEVRAAGVGARTVKPSDVAAPMSEVETSLTQGKGYDDWTVDRLTEEHGYRTIDGAAPKRKADLVAVLRADDVAHPPDPDPAT